MSCSPDRWSCPRCSRTVTRGLEQPADWTRFLRDIQTAHGTRCAKKRSTK